MASDFVVSVRFIIPNMSPTKLSTSRSRFDVFRLIWLVREGVQEMRQNGRANQAPPAAPSGRGHGPGTPPASTKKRDDYNVTIVILNRRISIASAFKHFRNTFI